MWPIMLIKWHSHSGTTAVQTQRVMPQFKKSVSNSVGFYTTFTPKKLTCLEHMCAKLSLRENWETWPEDETYRCLTLYFQSQKICSSLLSSSKFLTPGFPLLLPFIHLCRGWEFGHTIPPWKTQCHQLPDPNARCPGQEHKWRAFHLHRRTSLTAQKGAA